MKLYKTTRGPLVEDSGLLYELPLDDWDKLVNRNDLEQVLAGMLRQASVLENFDWMHETLAPIGQQEVWAAGVTYYRSRTARIEESKSSGGGNFYDRVYSADRPELFFKATPHRVAGPGQVVRIRRDSKWNVPEPELALAVNSDGKIIGYTIGNDMSSRDIEGENPLYLPQAKVYDGSCALGPAILIATEPIPSHTRIQLEIRRGSQVAFAGSTTISQMKRDLVSLVEYLYRETTFPDGCILLTGTGVVPPDDFTLQHGDEIAISIDGIGTLLNTVE
jgi:2-dehydro-3-deoxy-D-arabinonate dehydratase